MRVVTTVCDPVTGRLTPDSHEELSNWILEKLDHPGCCSDPHIAAVERLFFVPAMEWTDRNGEWLDYENHSSRASLEYGIPSVSVVCRTCGNLRFYKADRVFNLLPEN